jgi:hypothetical protein
VVGSVVTPLDAPVLAAGATAAALATFAGLLADQERRWRRSDASLQPNFLPDGTPAMSVTTFGDTAPAPRARAAFPVLPGADSARTDASKAAS